MIPVEMANRGVNKFVARKISHGHQPGASVLVLGCGAGVVEYYLKRLNFLNVKSTDLFFEKPEHIDSVNFFAVDFNEPDFAAKIVKHFGCQFSVVVAVEVVEHIYNTDFFLANVANLLVLGGKAYVSTPNVHCAMSRAETVLTGYPSWYYVRPKVGDHVAPQFDRIFDYLADRSGLEIERTLYKGSYVKYLLSYPKYSWKSCFYSAGLLILTPILSPLMLVDSRSLWGLNKVYVLKKSVKSTCRDCGEPVTDNHTPNSIYKHLQRGCGKKKKKVRS